MRGQPERTVHVWSGQRKCIITSLRIVSPSRVVKVGSAPPIDGCRVALPTSNGTRKDPRPIMLGGRKPAWRKQPTSGHCKTADRPTRQLNRGGRVAMLRILFGFGWLTRFTFWKTPRRAKSLLLHHLRWSLVSLPVMIVVLPASAALRVSARCNAPKPMICG